MKDDDYHYHECVCRRKRSTRIMWAKRPLVPNTPASAIIHIHLATQSLITTRIYQPSSGLCDGVELV